MNGCLNPVLQYQMPWVFCKKTLYMSSILKKRSGGVGVNGCVVSEQTVLEEGDRLEFYLPLVTDPKSARRQRGLHRKQIT